MTTALVLVCATTLAAFLGALFFLRTFGAPDVSRPMALLGALACALGWPVGLGLLIFAACCAVAVCALCLVVMLPVFLVAALRGKPGPEFKVKLGGEG